MDGEELACSVVMNTIIKHQQTRSKKQEILHCGKLKEFCPSVSPLSLKIM